MMLTARAAVVQRTFPAPNAGAVARMSRRCGTHHRALWHLRRDGQSTTQRHLSALGSKIRRSPDLKSGAQWAAGFRKPGFMGGRALKADLRRRGALSVSQLCARAAHGPVAADAQWGPTPSPRRRPSAGDVSMIGPRWFLKNIGIHPAR